MDGGNFSAMTGFIFLGIVGNTEDKVTIYHGSNCLSHWPMANLGMMLLLEMDPQLHTSMYFFLGHLSFCVLCYSTAMHPKMIMDLFAKNKSIPFYGCALQFLVFCIFADSECLLLAVMAYDRYRAISSPLLYAVSMSSRVCSLLVAGVYLLATADALIHTTLAFRLCFC
uniref:G-protein coupled receptors family 1 profile domain-containing protein n=1 Tax=Capra hircus TaxID=9925 RepID=A0A8C2RZC7_CAPHI